MQKFKKKLNDYLAELSKYSTKETVKFLTMNRSNQIEERNEPSDSLELLRAFWSTENLVKVEVTIGNDMLIEKDVYTVSIFFNGRSTKVQMKLVDIFEFYNAMRRKYRGFPFTRLQTTPPKDLVEKVKSFFVEILNDIDVLGPKVYSFFTFEPIRKLCKLAENKATLDLPNFTIVATVKKITIGIQIQKHLVLVILFLIIEIQY